MSESKESKAPFLGTYFERDSVFRLARLADIFSWIVLALYVAQVLLSLLVYVLQISRGFIYPGGITDVAQQVLYMLQTITPGLWYFVGLQGAGRLLLIFMDIEENTRRAARPRATKTPD